MQSYSAVVAEELFLFIQFLVYSRKVHLCCLKFVLIFSAFAVPSRPSIAFSAGHVFPMW